MDGIARVKQHLHELTPKLKALGEYILKKPEDVMHLSISDLSRKANCSETTIFRFCQELGYTGFQEFKISLAQSVNQTPLQDIHESVNPNDDGKTILQKIFASHIQGLQDAMAIIDPEGLELAASTIINASQLYFFGNGGSAAVATDAYRQFIRIGTPCFYHTDTHFQSVSIGAMPTDAVIVAISHSGKNKAMVEALRAAKARGIKIIAITSFIKSELGKIADITLSTPTNEIHLRSETMTSRIAQVALIDALYVAVTLQRHEKTLENLKEIRKSVLTQRF